MRRPARHTRDSLGRWNERRVSFVATEVFPCTVCGRKHRSYLYWHSRARRHDEASQRTALTELGAHEMDQLGHVYKSLGKEC